MSYSVEQILEHQLKAIFDPKNAPDECIGIYILNLRFFYILNTYINQI